MLVAIPGILPIVSSKESDVAEFAWNLHRLAISSVGAIACTLRAPRQFSCHSVNFEYMR
jgi:hypothetical protein